MKNAYFTPENIEAISMQIIADVRETGFRSRIWKLNENNAALLITDMQRYFTNPASHAYIPSVSATLYNISSLIDLFHKLNRPVIFSQHINSDENAGMMGEWWNDLILKDTEFAQIDQKFFSEPSAVIQKNQYDAFYKTSLEYHLKNTASSQLIVCGVMTNLCCETTVRSAFVKGFDTFFPVDATATYNQELHTSTFRNLAFGFTPLLRTSDILKSLANDE